MARDEAERAYHLLAGRLDAREHSPEMVWEQREAAEGKIPAPLDDTDVDRSLAAFMASEDSAERWIMPGLIARGERIVITGGEGLGKGVLLRQLAASVASGWHPFGAGRTDPARVLYVDLENPRPAIRQTFWQCHRALVWDYSSIELRYEPDGVDLLGSGLGWLHQVSGDYAPDLLVIGPAYKAIGDGDERDGVIISRLLRRLDQVRRRHDVAIVVEQHSPHEQAGQQRTVRPVGSSMWRRWCDIGVGLRPHDMSQEDKADQYIAAEAERAEWVDVIRWKPPRGRRDWPKQLRYGRPDQLPWIPAGHYEPKRIEAAA
jgi:replicative DNA helicase